MSKIIEVSGLSKSYTISHEGRQSYTALRDVMTQKAKRLFSFRGWKSETIVTKEEFWALKDISFDIEQGDRIGIIGRNGAGKSTLLKILSRITEPTSGSIKIKGRIAALLEVGTGFHPELTGRENIFLNGAILGMSRVEIRRHFDAIVDFAEVEKFLDTPVKRYSSGMYVRLAFAVAAHLEPEILIVDEVLAVGDAQFQKKCLGKMEDVSRNEGRTVLFVSHQMRVIQALCNKTLILSSGRVGFNGSCNDGLHFYENLIRTIKAKQILSGFQLTFDFFSNQIENPKTLFSLDPITFKIAIYSPEDITDNYINICIDTAAGDRIVHMRNDWNNFNVKLNKGANCFTLELDHNSLAPGLYDIWCRAVIGKEMRIIDTDFVSVEIKGEHTSGYIAHFGNWSKEN